MTASGNLLYIRDPSAPGETPRVTRMAYDKLGRRITLTLPDGTATHTAYDPFGNLTADSFNNADNFPDRFSTKPMDPATGLLYYGRRWYDQVAGRWPSRDPIGENGGLNLYGFIWNDGINWVDFLGLWGDGNQGNPKAPEKSRGHSDFPNLDKLIYGTRGLGFDYTKEDHDPSTRPENPLTGTWRHFRPLEDSEADLARACKDCFQGLFERAAHQMQDFFAHYGQGYRTYGKNKCGSLSIGHLDDTFNYWLRLPGRKNNHPEPDNAVHYEDAFDAAARRTRLWLDRWLKCCHPATGNGQFWYWEPKPGRDEELCSGPPPHNPWGETAPPPNYP